MTQNNDQSPMIPRDPIGNTPTIAKLIPRSVGQPLYAPEGYAQIEVTRHQLAFGRYYETYRWIGKAWWPVRAPFDVLQRGVLPYKLRQIEKVYEWDAAICVREDGWLMPLAWLTDLRYRLYRAWRWVYARIIMTAYVWGLAYVPQWEEPTWRHLGRKR